MRVLKTPFSLTIIIDYYEHAAVIFVNIFLKKKVTAVNALQRQIQEKGYPDKSIEKVTEANP